MSRSPEVEEFLWSAFHEASLHDATIRVSRSTFQKMLGLFVSPRPYSRELLFSRMLAGEPSVLTGFPSPTRGSLQGLTSASAGAAIMSWFSKNKSRERYRIYYGPKGVQRELTLCEIATKWKTKRAIFGVTDLHIRQTIMEEIIDPDQLSAFNILCHSSTGAQAQEMFSFVISSRGYVTDSHSDAPDSSNFCFVGKKLWLAWDTYEGLKHGLQDVERIPIAGQARFDINSWLSLKSARWFLVEPNNTLFLPANFTHKVITIESYVGVGGFYVALPNCLRVLSHWITRGPLWSKRDLTGENDNLIGDIADTLRDRILKLRSLSEDERRSWGYDYLEPSARFFLHHCSRSQINTLWSDPRFKSVAEIITSREHHSVQMKMT